MSAVFWITLLSIALAAVFISATVMISAVWRYAVLQRRGLNYWRRRHTQAAGEIRELRNPKEATR